MHSEAELRRAATRAGCRVLELRRVETSFGPVWHGKHACPDNPATFRFLLEIAKLDVTDPLARQVALQLFAKYPGKTETKERARAVMAWVKKHVRYIREPKETFQSPSYTIRVGAGDCDDHANLVHAIARNAGISAKVLPLWKHGQVRHAVAQLEIGKQWQWAETTVDAELGEHPIAAVRRLKQNRADIGDLLPTVVLPDDARRYIGETDAGWKRLDQDVERSGVDASFLLSFSVDLAAWVSFREGALASVGFLNTKAVMDQTDRWVEKLEAWRRSLRDAGGRTTGPAPVVAGQGVPSPSFDASTKWIVGAVVGVAAVFGVGYVVHGLRA